MPASIEAHAEGEAGLLHERPGAVEKPQRVAHAIFSEKHDMKSAFELAMERLGGNLHEYSDEEKEQLLEVDRRIDAKIAQAKFAARERRAGLPEDPEKIKQFEDDLAVELRSLEQQREKKKDILREQFQKNATG